jgi:hypothetical protein
LLNRLLIFQILPIAWKQKFDNFFYSQQCPVKPPPPSSNKTDANGTECTAGDAVTTNGDVHKACPVDKKRI